MQEPHPTPGAPSTSAPSSSPTRARTPHTTSTRARAARSEGRLARPVLSGALAGMATVLVFTAIHQLLIGDIWFSLVPMLAIGAICGLALAWSYTVVVPEPGAGSWIGYNAVHLAALLLLGAVSIAVFEPVTTAAAIMAAGGPPPPELFDSALPFTIVYTLAAAIAIGLVWARTRAGAIAVLLTTAVLVFLFGVNLSILGLVELSGDGYRPLAEFLGLTVLVFAGNTAALLVLERRALLGPRR